MVPSDVVELGRQWLNKVAVINFLVKKIKYAAKKEGKGSVLKKACSKTLLMKYATFW